MTVRPTDTILPALTAMVGGLSIALWLQVGPPPDVQARVPGLDRPASVDLTRPDLPPQQETPVGEPVLGDGVPSAMTGRWPCFRGTARDAISTENVSLARNWPADGPPVLWTVELGEGYAGAAVANGKVYVLDYDEAVAADTLRCLSLDDGREIWHNSYPVELTRNHGMSRTVPALAGDCVVTLGPRGHLASWDAASGACHWLIDLVERFGAKVPLWYMGQCPLIDEDRLIVAPSGNVLMVAMDYRTGEVAWAWPNPHGWTMTHSSIVPMQLGDRRTYVYCASGGVAGVAADDGSLLWQSTEWTEQFALAPSPVVLPGNRIFLTAGYGSHTGSLILGLTGDTDEFTAEVLARLSPSKFAAEQHTPIVRDGHLLGVRKRSRGQLVCLDPEGNELWNSGRDHFGHGPFILADGVLLLLDNDGVLTLAEATLLGYQRLARHEAIPDAADAWGPMALVAGRLIVRDMTRMVCLDLRARE